MWLLLKLFLGTLGMNVKTECTKSPWEYFCHDWLYVTRYIKNSPFRFDICIFSIYKNIYFYFWLSLFRGWLTFAGLKMRWRDSGSESLSRFQVFGNRQSLPSEASSPWNCSYSRINRFSFNQVFWGRKSVGICEVFNKICIQLGDFQSCNKRKRLWLEVTRYKNSLVEKYYLYFEVDFDNWNHLFFYFSWKKVALKA